MPSRQSLGPHSVARDYSAAFIDEMVVPVDQLDDPAALSAALSTLDPVARDLFDMLRLAVGDGGAVPERFRGDVDEDGLPLWRAGLLLPRIKPGQHVSVDPRYFGGRCRLNPSLGGLPLWPELSLPDALSGHLPPTHARWDAVVVAAALEAQPLRLTQHGALRKDDLKRFLGSFGDTPPERWSLALSWARASGLARTAGDLLRGYPESRPRTVTDPSPVFDSEGEAVAAALVLRVVRADWIAMDHLETALQERCPTVLAPRTRPRTRWARREGPWLARAVDVLHRLGFIEAVRSATAVTHIRRPSPDTRRTPAGPGLILTPDRDLLVAVGDLPDPIYGRICRIARFVEGDVMHRHRVERAGVVADLSAGHTDLHAFLMQWSRTGVPDNVAASIAGWQQSASRVALVSGVSVLEDPQASQRFRVLDGPAPDGARLLDYSGGPPATLHVEDDVLLVPYGRDALTVRAVAAQVGMPLDPGVHGWRYELAPAAVADPGALLEALAAVHAGPLPGNVEAAVVAAAEAPTVSGEAAWVLSLPASVADALVRDRVLRHTLSRRLDATTCVVAVADVPAVRARLEWLGIQVDLTGVAPGPPPVRP